jgi:hypothetical protein
MIRRTLGKVIGATSMRQAWMGRVHVIGCWRSNFNLFRFVISLPNQFIWNLPIWQAIPSTLELATIRENITAATAH